MRRCLARRLIDSPEFPVHLALLAHLILGPAVGQIDEIAILREQDSVKNVGISLEVLAQDTAAGGFLGNVTKSDQKIGKKLGKKQMRYCFGLDWNGDGHDEIAIVNVFPNEEFQPLELSIYTAPKSLGGNLGAPLASWKKGAIKGAGFDRVVAMGSIDFDGDKKDEIMFVRAMAIGEERLEIYKAPKAKSKGLGVVLASDWTFGPALEDNFALGSGDVDADGKEDILCVRHVQGGPDKLSIHKAPIAAITEAALLRSDESIAAADGATILNAFPIQLTSSVGFHIGLVRRDASNLVRIDIHAAPNAIGGDIGTVLATEGPLSGDGVQAPVFNALVIHHAQPLPWADLEGALNAYYHIAYLGSDSSIVDEWIGPYPGFSGDGDAQNGLTISVPSGQVLVAGVSGWTTGSSVGYPAFPGNTAQFLTTKSSGVSQVGDLIIVTYPTSKIDTLNGKKIVRYTSPGTPQNFFPIGEVQIPGAPMGQDLRASIMEYYFTK